MAWFWSSFIWRPCPGWDGSVLKSTRLGLQVPHVLHNKQPSPAYSGQQNFIEHLFVNWIACFLLQHCSCCSLHVSCTTKYNKLWNPCWCILRSPATSHWCVFLFNNVFIVYLFLCILTISGSYMPALEPQTKLRGFLLSAVNLKQLNSRVDNQWKHRLQCWHNSDSQSPYIWRTWSQ